MQHIGTQTWIGTGLWLLALAVDKWVNGPIALVVAIVATVVILLGIAGTETAQRQIPLLGKLPLVQNHAYRAVPMHTIAPTTTPTEADSAEDERRQLLLLARLVNAELETSRYRLTVAEREEVGWTHDYGLPTERYYNWSHSVLTVDEKTVTEALEGFYQWAYQMNDKMNAREANDRNSIGNELRGLGLGLIPEDLAEIKEGLDRIANAQDHLQARISQLTKSA